MMGGIDLEVEDAAMIDDRNYFAEHPGEHERVRLAHPGELGGSAAWIRVVKIAPGVRARLPWIVGAS